jgi:hypothetical protein
MSRIALLMLVANLAVGTALLCQTGAGKLRQAPVARHGRLVCAARAVRVHNDDLTMTAPVLIPSDKPVPRGGRDVLIYGNGHVALGLWAAMADVEAQRATPTLGMEGPGVRFTKAVLERLATGPIRSHPVAFEKALPLTLVFLDSAGRPTRTQQAHVRQFEIIDWPSRR